MVKLLRTLESCFKDKKAEFICINKFYWTFQLDELKELFSFLLDNIYVKFRGRIYKQVAGIPIGCDCAPLVVDLFLHWYEHDFISRSVTNKESYIHVLKFATRYIYR